MEEEEEEEEEEERKREEIKDNEQYAWKTAAVEDNDKQGVPRQVAGRFVRPFESASRSAGATQQVSSSREKQVVVGPVSGNKDSRMRVPVDAHSSILSVTRRFQLPYMLIYCNDTTIGLNRMPVC